MIDTLRRLAEDLDATGRINAFVDENADTLRFAQQLIQISGDYETGVITVFEACDRISRAFNRHATPLRLVEAG